MKKLLILLPMAMAVIILLANIHTEQKHPSEMAGPASEDPNPIATSEAETPWKQQRAQAISPSHPDNLGHIDKQAKASSSPNADATNGTDDDRFRYQGDVLFPYLSWDEKMRLYYHGRTSSAVRYPLGLDFQGVQQLSDNVYSINEHELVQQADKQDLMTHAKIDDSNGRPTFSEVVPGGVFDRLGILSGDQITSLDGTPVHSYADLYTAYQGIQGRNEVTIHVQRNGHDIEFTYFIQ